MNLLLDTHAFLWFIANDPRLSSRAQSLIQEPGNRRLFSIRQPAPFPPASLNETGGEQLSSGGRVKPNCDGIVRGEPIAKMPFAKAAWFWYVLGK